jgi:hypothetical protein
MTWAILAALHRQDLIIAAEMVIQKAIIAAAAQAAAMGQR